MKVAIVGSSGYIASFLLKRWEREDSIKTILKIDQTADADAFLELSRPENFNYELLSGIDYIVFTAAISGPDKCAEDFDNCWKINVTGTNYFIGKALDLGCRILFFSSDAVFGNDLGTVFTENSETMAHTPYGRMKKAVEDEWKANPYFKAIRLAYVTSEKDRFVSYCLQCIRNGEIADVFHPFYRNCITVSDVVQVVMWFLDHWNEYEPFVLNVAGNELVSRVRIADEVNRIYQNRLKYTITVPGGSFYKNRPAITQMKSLYMQKYNILNPQSFTEKIQKELEKVNL